MGQTPTDRRLIRMEKLALYGGTPVRDTMLARGWPGAGAYDEAEAKKLYDVTMAKSPFRYYGYATQGMVDQLEKNFAKRIQTNHVLAVTSGTAALVVALKAAGIGPGHKVIVPACTFVASAGAVVCAGAVPVFADVDDSMNIDPNKIGDVVDSYTKAIITVPLMGNPCQMDAIMEQAKKYNLLVIEDVAQSMGSSFHGRPMGTWGDLGTFSLQLNKIITSGEGGMVATNNDHFYERAVRYHDQGMFREKEGFLTDEADHILIGQNYRMSELTGAVACAQLEKLDGILSRMRQHKRHIKDELKKIKGLTFRRIVDEAGDAAAGLMMYMQSKEQAKLFNQAMQAENVHCFAMYDGRPVYMMPQILYKKTIDANGFPFNQFPEEIHYSPEMCPVATDLMPRSCCISISSELTDQDIEDIICAVQKVAAAIL